MILFRSHTKHRSPQGARAKGFLNVHAARHLLTFALLLYPSVLLAQNQSAIARIDSLNARSAANWYTNPEQTIAYAEQALQLARNSGYKRGEAEALNNIGVGYYFSSDYDKVLEYYKNTLDIYQQIGDEEGISKVGTLYFRIARYRKALENYEAALAIAKKSGDKKQIVQLVSNIADVYSNLGDYDSSLQWYNNLLFNQEQIGDSIGQAVTVEKIGRLHYNRGIYYKALTSFERLHRIYLLLGSRDGQATAFNQLGSTSYMLKNEAEAIVYFNQSIDIQKELNDQFGLTANWLNLGRLYLSVNQLSKSLTFTRLAVETARRHGENEQLREGLKLLAIVQSDMHNYAEAFKAQLEYSSMLEKKNLEEKNNQLANTLVLYELGQKKQENDILQARSENLRLSLEKESLNKWRLSLAATILFVVIAIGIVIYRYVQKKRDNSRLEEEVRQAVDRQQQQQKIIFHQSSLTSLGELAAGIAHEINQPMQNISLSSEIIRDELADPDFNKAFVQKTVKGIFDDIERVRGIVDHIRIFSSGQKEEIVELFNPDKVIFDALKMVRQQMINHGIQLEELYEAPDVLLLGNPHKFEQVILNLIANARDAVVQKENSVKRIAVVTSWSASGGVVIQIKDNGIGIEADKLTDIFLPFFTTKKLGQGTGLGLAIAHGIITQMNGRIIPFSTSGEGTVMTIELPVSKP